MEIHEIIRRWQAGSSPRQIAAGVGLARNTVRKYLAAAQAEGIVQEGPEPTGEQLSRLATAGRSGLLNSQAPSDELLEPWGDQVYQWLTGERLQLTRIHQLLAARGCAMSYSTLRRFVLKRNWGRPGKATVRMEDTPPGEVAEADFGRLGLIPGPATGRRKQVWAMIIVCAIPATASSGPCTTRSWRTSSPAWRRPGPSSAASPNTWSSTIALPRWPRRTPCIPSSLTASWNIPSAGASSPDAARSRHPKDKPKVERGVPYARERFFKGGEFQDLADVRVQAQRWCRDIAGLRIHGTTRRQPLLVFLDEERPALLPWNGEPYEIADWRHAKVHQDHHIQCLQALYSGSCLPLPIVMDSNQHCTQFIGTLAPLRSPDLANAPLPATRIAQAAYFAEMPDCSYQTFAVNVSNSMPAATRWLETALFSAMARNSN